MTVKGAGQFVLLPTRTCTLVNSYLINSYFICIYIIFSTHIRVDLFSLIDKFEDRSVYVLSYGAVR